MLKTYKKKIDPALDAELKAAEWFGSIRLGTRHIFRTTLLSTRYVPLSEVDHAWRRVEQVEARTGCCSNDFSRHFLMLALTDGSVEKLSIGEALYRHEPENLIAALEHAGCRIRTGSNE